MQNSQALARIKASVVALAKTIGAPETSLPTYGNSEDFARPHIEAIGECVYFVVVERGRELVRESYVDDDALLEQVFNGVASQMASDFELRNRRTDQDFRRQWFARKLELLGVLNPEWAVRERSRLMDILRRHPFSDGLEPRDVI
jgi:hypothetical protein